MERNVKEIFEIYRTAILLNAKMASMQNPSFVFTEDFIRKEINKLSANNPFMSLSDKEKEDLVKNISSFKAVYQEPGVAILGNAENHDYDWFKKLRDSKGFEPYYWERYEQYLRTKKGFAPNVIDRLKNTTLEDLMSYIGNPNDTNAFKVRGLVVGDIQSGKTSNYIGLITAAADAGYKIIFLLTGTIESLRRQTQIRVEEGFIGWDSANGKDVGVGRGPRIPKAFTSRSKDFTGSDNQNTNFRIEENSEPLVFVVKKNVSVLTKIYSAIKALNTHFEDEKIDCSVLMVDDEADNASINTNKKEDDPTKINKLIREILALFTKTTYVGFTATPFANVFISPEDDKAMKENDLFPKNFIYALKAPSNYCGARKYFFDENPYTKTIEDADDSLFPMSHKKELKVNRLFPSVYNAVNDFLLANVIRDLRDPYKSTHRSMLINMSRFKDVQKEIEDNISDYVKTVIRIAKQTSKMDLDSALENSTIKKLKDTFEKDYYPYISNHEISWKNIFNKLYESIKDVDVIVVNSSRNSTKLDYDRHPNGYRVIAVGGLALSRGLTLEGLVTSYFYRNTATFDVLMQMGRWFGYRDGYQDLVRIYMNADSAQYYKEISESIEDLKSDIEKMKADGKTPLEYGIRVRNGSEALGITAANKMRNARVRKVVKSFYGNVFETPYLNRDLNIETQNIDKTISFLNSLPNENLDSSITYPYFRNISASSVVKLIGQLKFNEANSYFDNNQLIKFINKHESDMPFYDIYVIGGSVKDKESPKFNNDLSVPLVKRRFDVPRKYLIRINAQRAHLWGKSDTSVGLTKVQKQFVLDHTSGTATDYFNVPGGRNPLLIIYFIDPINKDDPQVQNEDTLDQLSPGSKTENLRLYKDLRESKYKCIVGFVIGFPYKEGQPSKVENYTVNINCDYYQKSHEEDYENYGDEE